MIKNSICETCIFLESEIWNTYKSFYYGFPVVPTKILITWCMCKRNKKRFKRQIHKLIFSCKYKENRTLINFV